MFSKWKKEHKIAKVGINGFGRIGRLVLRAAFLKGTVRVTAINDPFLDLNYMAYMLKYDSTHRRFPLDIKVEENQLVINGFAIRVYHCKEPACVPWDEVGAVYVVESSGLFKSSAKAKDHMAYDKCRRVIITSDTHDDDIPTIVMGLNQQEYRGTSSFVSSASSELQCLAPLAHIIHENFGIVEGLVTFIHSATSANKVVDAPTTSCWRNGRSFGTNIIPTSGNRIQAIKKVLPDLGSRIKGVGFTVPTPNVSVLDFTCTLERATSFIDIEKVIKEYSETHFRGILGTTHDQVVSADYNGEDLSGVFDIDASMMLSDSFFKLVAWYDNEFAYSCRVVELIAFMFSIDNPKW